MNKQTHIMIDIEALGLRPGAAIIELAAVEFCPQTGKTGEAFFVKIEPQSPFWADLETLEWHAKNGTWPREVDHDTESIGSALMSFAGWLESFPTVDAFWSWGSTYDFPLLAAAYEFAGVKPPWNYWDCRCARTMWQVAFGDRRHAPRPHDAIIDARMAAKDVMEALAFFVSETPGTP